jgi:hypothetical protein
MEINGSVRDLTCPVGFLDPTPNIIQVGRLEVDFLQAALEPFPVAVKTPEPTLISSDDLVDPVAEQTAAVLRGNDRIPQGTDGSVNVGQFAHQAWRGNENKGFSNSHSGNRD